VYGAATALRYDLICYIRHFHSAAARWQRQSQAINNQPMYKLIAFFTRPDNVEEFDAHYNEVHAPLMKKVPGMERLVVTRNPRSFAGESPYYLIAEMHFADKDAFKAAMASEVNKAAGKDVMGFAGKLVTMVHGEASEV
jgi:uncharacterized protein (TIGR02118 family)